MPSTFSWLDHSDEDRRRVLDAIDRFKESDTRDELGLASIRDGFADLFFPGTSTVQTRARYFLFVPWIYISLQEKVGADAIAGRAKKEEFALKDALLASDENDGTFGRLAGATLKRLPSNIYWQGLAAWGIRRFRGSQEDYHRHFGDLHRRLQSALRDDDGDAVERVVRAWDSHLPDAPKGFPKKASFRLTRAEAEYLADKITLAAPDSLLAFLVRRGRTLEGTYPWAHPQVGELPREVRRALDHAQLLAETMHGAALLYNLMLAEESSTSGDPDDRVGMYRDRIQTWCEELGSRRAALVSWDRAAFWALAAQVGNVRGATRDFVERWLSLSPWEDAERTMASEPARALLRGRERALKGARARLGNPRALELWGGAAGTERLNYRWGAALRILRDIHAGLRSEEADA